MQCSNCTHGALCLDHRDSQSLNDDTEVHPKPRRHQKNDAAHLEEKKGQEIREFVERPGLNTIEATYRQQDVPQPKNVQLDAVDAKQRHELGKDDNLASDAPMGPRIIISFPPGDPENPYNWSKVGCDMVVKTTVY